MFLVLKQRAEGPLKDFLTVPLAKLKQILAAFVNEKFNMILTEQACQWIEKTDNPHLVKVLLVKLIIDDANDIKHAKLHSDIRKAMFENYLLIQRIAEYMGDETIMHEIKKFVDYTE